MQAEWEEDKEAEGFLLLGAVPDGKANGNSFPANLGLCQMYSCFQERKSIKSSLAESLCFLMS